MLIQDRAVFITSLHMACFQHIRNLLAVVKNLGCTVRLAYLKTVQYFQGGNRRIVHDFDKLIIKDRIVSAMSKVLLKSIFIKSDCGRLKLEKDNPYRQWYVYLLTCICAY
jgi:hypothetical protein